MKGLKIYHTIICMVLASIIAIIINLMANNSIESSIPDMLICSIFAGAGNIFAQLSNKK